jgi:hypothetical protein
VKEREREREREREKKKDSCDQARPDVPPVMVVTYEVVSPYSFTKASRDLHLSAKLMKCHHTKLLLSLLKF